MTANYGRLRVASGALALLTLGAGTAQAETTYPTSLNGDGAVSGGYNISRWGEDWRAMANKAKRNDPLDRLKFLPLDKDGDIYVTLSGELRLRVNETTNPNLRDAEAQRQDIVRVTGGADLHLGEHFRFYGELAHGRITGINLGAPAATLRNDLTVQQAFMEAKATVQHVDIGLRYGRQEFVDGPNLLTSQRDNNTIHYTLNGLRMWARGSKARIDLFDFKPTAYGDLGLEDDVSDPARRFSGVTLGFILPEKLLGGSKLSFDPFFWRRRNTVGAWGGRVGPATRYYLGAKLAGDIGPVTLDWSANRQWGSYRNQSIDAWQVMLAQNIRVSKGPMAPRIGFHADYASGGGGYGDGSLRDAYAPFGNNIYYSYQLYLTPSNLVALAPTFSLTPVKPVKLQAEYQFTFRDNTYDAVYRANGQPFAGTQNFHARKIGDVARLQAIWTISPRVSITGRYEHLAAGPALKQAGYRSSDFLASWISLRF
ncbi:hypothetical protein EOE18_12835 [Novosphingobium umbonatum]|uniref:Alginate export domain-containing protein n=1 Tax=Novosphingobium umbonatum TaxID=1908524 RepID=A0A437N2A8_9SPHN|nr:alginate export family protein [Novosphingobium umbonatum]RVU04060.1 hypothetical protein EOE18_12835 [Novosphingobium umbonatum]